MHKAFLPPIYLCLVPLCLATYTLVDDYVGNSFLDKFDFFTDPDPTHGFVTYVDQTAAIQAGLVELRNNSVYLGVDHGQTALASGRPSVRLTSKGVYNTGLIILDLLHMPGNICGVWPAFWTCGPDWPQGGEIDIIEGVSMQASNHMYLHTQSSCVVGSGEAIAGTLLGIDCAVDTDNVGCGVEATNNDTYGDPFNLVGGGVYAMEWTEQAINIWFFPRSSIPNDIQEGVPDPSGWTTPLAAYSGPCQFNSSFVDQRIIFDTTFCGDWAGSVWTADPVCSLKAPSCEEFVADNPQEFEEAYWLISSLKVFQPSGELAGLPAPATTSRTTTMVPVTLPTAGVPSLSGIWENQTGTTATHLRPSWSHIPFSVALAPVRR